jgi:hypothetical protein
MAPDKIEDFLFPPWPEPTVSVFRCEAGGADTFVHVLRIQIRGGSISK